jgi:hypothetical protein
MNCHDCGSCTQVRPETRDTAGCRTKKALLSTSAATACRRFYPSLNLNSSLLVPSEFSVGGPLIFIT